MQSKAAPPPPPIGFTPTYAPPIVKAQTWRWIGKGWDLVKGDLVAYVLMALFFAILNGVVPMILQGPLTAGIEIATLRKLAGRRIEFADMFKGFNYFVPTLAAHLVTMIFVAGGTLLCIIPGLVIAAMYIFVNLFIVDKRMEFWPAMQASHAIVKNDYFGFTMFILAIALVNVLGVLCCVVGILVTLPLSYAAITVAYQELVGFDPNALPA
ncbi:MAG: hypothetical protein ABIZ80_24185 [Bryobacteraceae bacterium]